MGLKRLGQNDSRIYMYFNISSSDDSKHTLEAIILSEENPCTVKITTSNNDLRLWCGKLGKSPEDYLEQLCEAVTSEDTNVGVFDVQQNHLIWKQYFPDKDLYGKKGKFKVEKVEYKEAVERVLAGVMKDLHESSRQIDTLTRETHHTTIKLEKAQELADRSIQMKEDFEKEIYSKCAALINAKKLRIHQLRSTHPSSSAGGRSGCLVRTGDEVAGSSTPPVKRPRQQQEADSDGYSSDTDVDDPDEEIDTDEERAISLSPAKPSRERGERGTARRGDGKQDQNEVKSKASNMPDSQELFNASLEEELYAGATVAQQTADTSTSHAKPNTQSPPQLTRSKAAEPVPVSSNLAASKSDPDDDYTQKSILSTLF